MTPGPSGPRAVLFDAMGTLLTLEAPAPVLVRGLREDHGLEVAPERAEAAMAAEMRHYRAHHDEGHDERSLHELRLRCAAVLRDALGAGAGPIATEALLGTLLGALRFRAFADAPGALAALRARGRRLVVVSNWDVSLPGVLEQVGLAHLVDDVVTSAGCGASKPQPRIFAAALERARVSADRALHVGDSIEHDVTGARSAGIAAVLIDRGPVGARPIDVTVIRSLAELPAIAA